MPRKFRAKLPSWVPGSTRYDAPVKLKTGDRRIYHVHVRKTAGTSINHTFLRLGGEGENQRYLTLAGLEGHELDAQGYRFVGWDVTKINRGNYFYAFSHTPFWGLDLPPSTYSFTCLRDPVKRVLSHYQMLIEYRETGFPHPCRVEEEPWLGESLLDFIERMPARHLLNQLWMFSERMDVEEAVANLRSLSRVLANERLGDGIAAISQELGLPLSIEHRRKSRPLEFNPEHVAELRRKLEPEYRMLEAVRSDSPAGKRS